MNRLILVIFAALAALVSAPAIIPAHAKTLFGCDYGSCDTVMPSIGQRKELKSDGSAAYDWGSDGPAGVYSYNDTTLDTVIDDRFKGSQLKDIVCVVQSNGTCNADPIEIKGNRDKVIWTYTLDENGAVKVGDRQPGSDFGIRFGDQASFAPPSNDWKKRCTDNCDFQLKRTTNIINYQAASSAHLANWFSAGAGLIGGVVVGIAATPETTPIGGGMAAATAAWTAYSWTHDRLKDNIAEWTQGSIAAAGMAWNDCMLNTCHVGP